MALRAIAICGLVGVVGPPLSALPYPVRKETRLEVTARPILIESDEKTTNLGEIRLEIPPSGITSRELELPGPSSTMPRRIRIEAEGGVASGGGPHRLTLRSLWRAADGATAKAERDLEVREGATGFFEAAHGPGWRLTLAIQAEAVERVVARAPRSPGHAIVFRVEIGRVVAGDYVPLETNDLSTFRGEPVEYSFRLGGGTTLEQLRLVLTPVRIEGDVAEIRLQVAGTMHAGRESPLLLSRNETVLTGRETTSEVTAAVGDPPDGFRFRITPVW
jgi:hypothetical protein